MTENMIGKFCWQELLTKNAKGTIDFYSKLFGWTVKQSPMHPGYNLITAKDGTEIGGIMQLDEKFGSTPSHCMPYVAVENVDTLCEQAKSQGGTVCVEPTDIPNVGRFAVITDHEGVSISIIALTPPPSKLSAA